MGKTLSRGDCQLHVQASKESTEFGHKERFENCLQMKIALWLFNND